MRDLLSELRECIDKLRSLDPRLPFSDEEARAQAELILITRRIWSSLPNNRLKTAEKRRFIERHLGDSVPEEHVSLATRTERRQRFSEEQLLRLEKSQMGRCALCGTLLTQGAEPHLDHIVPVVFGGQEDISNTQILCKECNLGKSDSIHWLMHLPFFSESPGNQPTSKLRYCVLQRYQGRCAVSDCAGTSSTSKLYVVSSTPPQDGGRIIFDNLEILCDAHYSERISDLQEKASLAVRSGRNGRFTFR